MVVVVLYAWLPWCRPAPELDFPLSFNPPLILSRFPPHSLLLFLYLTIPFLSSVVGTHFKLSPPPPLKINSSFAIHTCVQQHNILNFVTLQRINFKYLFDFFYFFVHSHFLAFKQFNYYIFSHHFIFIFIFFSSSSLLSSIYYSYIHRPSSYLFFNQ